MILDTLENADRYASLHPNFARAFAFLRRTDLADLPVGRVEIDGDALFAFIAMGHGRKPDEGQIETHDNYIDIQFVIEGTDSIGWKARTDLGAPNAASRPADDVAFYDDAPTAWSPIKPGTFGVYFPEDGHLPMISDGHLHKAIVKVAI